MKKNKFEQDFLRSFEEYQPQLNTDEIWDNIEPKLKRKKSGGVLFFWFLIGGLGIGFLLWNNDFSSWQAPLQEATLIELEKKNAPSEITITDQGTKSISGGQTSMNDHYENDMEQSNLPQSTPVPLPKKLEQQSHTNRSSYYPLSKTYSQLPAEQLTTDQKAKQPNLAK